MASIAVPTPSRRFVALVVTALIAASIGFGMGSKAQDPSGHRPTATEVRELARTQAQAGTLSCWLSWREGKAADDEGHNEVICADLSKHGDDER